MTEQERAEWERLKKRRAIRNLEIEVIVNIVVSVTTAVLTNLYIRGLIG